MTVTTIHPDSSETSTGMPPDLDGTVHGTETCYLPWCDQDYGPTLNLGADPAHDHFGPEQRVETYVYGVNGDKIEQGVVRFQIEQSDEDLPGDPQTGDAHLYLTVGDAGDEYSCSVLMTFETAAELIQKLTGQIQHGTSSRSLRNPNELTVEQLDAAREAQATRWAQDREETPAATAPDWGTEGLLDELIEVTDPSHIKAHRWGRRIGNTRLGRRFPRIAATAMTVHLGLFERFAFTVGMELALGVNNRAEDGETVAHESAEASKRRRFAWAGRLYMVARDIAESSLGHFPRTVVAAAHLVLHGQPRTVFDLGFNAGLNRSHRSSRNEPNGCS